MQKFFTLLIITLISSSLKLNAQVDIIGSENYGILQDLSYDISVENRIFATTVTNHIVVSNDNGATWEVFYAFKTKTGNIKDLKVYDKDHLSFFMHNDAKGIYLLDIKTKEIAKKFTLPEIEGTDFSWIDSYDIDSKNSDIILANQMYKEGYKNKSKVYYTEDAGKNWNMVYFSDDHDKRSINRLAISPEKTGKLVLGLGLGPEEIDGGILISEDKGTTWAETLTGSACGAIEFDPKDPTHIIMGTGIMHGSDVEEALFNSNDGGKTWVKVEGLTFTDFTSDCIKGIKFSKKDDNIVYAIEY
ncbi:MAG: hypothetical protein ACEPOV_08490 [Hyphomicrobiales bacterium]